MKKYAQYLRILHPPNSPQNTGTELKNFNEFSSENQQDVYIL